MSLAPSKPSQAIQRKNQAVQAVLSKAPAWLQYLIGAYPDAWINEMTFFVLEDQFSHFSSDTMMDAVRLYVLHNAKFPKAEQLFLCVHKVAHLTDWDRFVQSMMHLGFELNSDNGERACFIHRHSGKEAIVYH